jgi:hypothetical protein
MSDLDDKALDQLKADCVFMRNLSEAYPHRQEYERAYEFAQRKVQAREREIFCSVKEIE